MSAPTKTHAATVHQIVPQLVNQNPSWYVRRPCGFHRERLSESTADVVAKQHNASPAKTARQATPARTLLDQPAEPVGGWWPEDVGEPQVREEGPMHPRAGTVVEHDEDAATLPLGTVVDYGCVITSIGDVMGRIAVHALNAHGRKHWRMQWRWKDGVSGARILYVPLREP
jgi:hypothetical protein